MSGSTDLTPGIPRAKPELRKALRTRRAGLSGEALQQSANGLRQHGVAFGGHLPPGSIIAGYLPFGQEPPVLPLLTELSSRHTIFVPVCLPGRRLNWVQWQPGAELHPGPLPGLLEPRGERHGHQIMARASVIFIPALAISRDGIRLGQGGGYYDRFLSELPDGPMRCAVVYDEEVLPAGSILAESWDQPVTHVLRPGAIQTLEAF